MHSAVGFHEFIRSKSPNPKDCELLYAAGTLLYCLKSPWGMINAQALAWYKLSPGSETKIWDSCSILGLRMFSRLSKC